MKNSVPQLNSSTSKVVNSLIDNVLNSPSFSWEKTWKNIATGASPYNPVTKVQYSGFNRFILQLNASIKGTNQFATFKQISNAGGKIIKGSKSIPLLFFTWKYFSSITKKSYDQKDIAKLPKNIQDSLSKYPFHNYFSVFSMNDVEGLEFPEIKIEEKNQPLESAQKIVDNWECKINIGLDNERAYYAPSMDLINMPHLQAFKAAENFYMTAFHEIAHSTGHKERLNRDLSGMFGNDKYAKEELVAELSSVLVGASLNLLTDEIIKNATAYLKSWTKRMQDKKNELFQGLNHAIKAYDYILKVVE